MTNEYIVSRGDYDTISNSIVNYVVNHINTPHISFSLTGTLENDYTWTFQYVGPIKEQGSIIDVLKPIYWNLIINNERGEEVPNSCETLYELFNVYPENYNIQ
jgi:hypothetical protein